ncbi:MAG: hypothetical protein PHV30_10230 [Candidatus Margulisbacteria bacterium]|nr:hypothetical protein [Candidatus Margulisiibacteriota bacterium]
MHNKLIGTKVVFLDTFRNRRNKTAAGQSSGEQAISCCRSEGEAMANISGAVAQMGMKILGRDYLPEIEDLFQRNPDIDQTTIIQLEAAVAIMLNPAGDYFKRYGSRIHIETIMDAAGSKYSKCRDMDLANYIFNRMLYHLPQLAQVVEPDMLLEMFMKFIDICIENNVCQLNKGLLQYLNLDQNSSRERVKTNLQNYITCLLASI